MQNFITNFNSKSFDYTTLLALIVALGLFGILLLIVPSIYLLSAIVFFIIYIVLHKYGWFLLLIIAPILALGFKFSIPINDKWSYDITFAEIILIVVAFIFVINNIFRIQKNKLKYNLVVIALGLYLIISLASFFYAPDKALFIAGMKVPVFAFISYTLARYYLNGQKRLEFFFAGLALTVIIISAQIFILFYQIGFSSRFFFERSSLLVPVGAIAFASSIIVMLLPLLFTVYVSRTKIVFRWLALVSFMVGFLAVCLSLGKGALLSLVIGLLFLFFAIKHKRHHIVWTVVLVAAVFAVVFAPFFEGLLARLGGTFTDANTSFRLQEYQLSWHIIKDHWFLGIGIGPQIGYYARFLFPNYNQLANNMIVQVALDLGLLGLSAFMFIAASLYRTIKIQFDKMSQRPVILYGICASVVVSFFNGLVEVTYFGLAYATIFWLLMGVASNIHTLRDSK